MNIENIETTNAFNKYIDPIFIIQNNLMAIAPKKFCERFDIYDYSLGTYQDEEYLRAGMCVELVKRIEKKLSFDNTQKLYSEKMLKLASNHDLDYSEVEKRTTELDETLFSHAKLQYCFDNYLKEISLNNNISILSCLMAIYAKIISIKKEKNPAEKVEGITNSKWYGYVREAMLEEEAFDIKGYSKLSLQELSEKLFDLIVECQFWLENSTEETMQTADLENVVLDLFVIEENVNYLDFKKEFEQKVYNWMAEEMHNREHII